MRAFAGCTIERRVDLPGPGPGVEVLERVVDVGEEEADVGGVRLDGGLAEVGGERGEQLALAVAQHRPSRCSCSRRHASGRVRPRLERRPQAGDERGGVECLRGRATSASLRLLIASIRAGRTGRGGPACARDLGGRVGRGGRVGPVAVALQVQRRHPDAARADDVGTPGVADEEGLGRARRRSWRACARRCSGWGLRAPAHAEDTTVSTSSVRPTSSTASARSQSQFEQIASCRPRARRSRSTVDRLVVALEDPGRGAGAELLDDQLVLAGVDVGLGQHRRAAGGAARRCRRRGRRSARRARARPARSRTTTSPAPRSAARTRARRARRRSRATGWRGRGSRRSRGGRRRHPPESTEGIRSLGRNRRGRE